MNRRVMCVAAIAALCGCASSAYGQIDVEWQAAADGDWSNGSNWVGGVSPNNSGPDTYRAEITVTGAAYTISLDTDVTVSELLLGSDDAVLEGVAAFGIDILDETTFTDVDLRMIGGGVRSFGTFTFDSAICDDLCDTPLSLESGSGSWGGSGDIALMGTSTFTIKSGVAFTVNSNQTMMLDPGAVWTNEGELTKTTSGLTLIDGGTFDNTGDLTLDAGTFRLDNGALDINGNSNTLDGGRWTVRTGAVLDAVGESVITQNAFVRLEGTGSFDALTGTLETIDSSGELELATGSTFTTAGDFTNNGRLLIESGTDFRVMPGSGLGNLSGGTLSGGTYEILDGGTLTVDSASITEIDADLTLSGSTADILDDIGATAFNGTLTIADAGELSIADSKFFASASDVTLDQAGTLRVDSSSTFEVDMGSSLTNFSAGVLSEGVFEIGGTLRFAGAAISTIDTDLTLNGTLSKIENFGGLDALAGLDMITTDGRLVTQGGRDVTTAGDLTNAGELVVGGPMGLDQTIVTVTDDLIETGTTTLDGGTLVIGGSFNQGGMVRGNGLISGSVMSMGMISPGFSPGRIDIDGQLSVGSSSVVLIEIFGLAPGMEHDVLAVNGALDFITGQSGTLQIEFAASFMPQPGQFFDVVLFQQAFGGFFEINVSPLPTGQTAIVRQLEDRIRVEIVPAPAPATAMLAGLGGFAMTRRHR